MTEVFDTMERLISCDMCSAHSFDPVVDRQAVAPLSFDTPLLRFFNDGELTLCADCLEAKL